MVPQKVYANCSVLYDESAVRLLVGGGKYLSSLLCLSAELN